MKLSQIVVTISFLAMICCTNNKSKNEHGHDHGPNGEHLHDHGNGTHSHDEEHEQEVFEITKDSIQIDSQKKITPIERKTHKHSDGQEHSH